ncbi:MAG: hypothetical protein HYZ49_03460 [Chloroflexi bacterium]|nr:hypothetical protein [Chloroflexota bacterium]
MDIEIFTLCDAAADYQGRLNILGVFDTIFASQMPAMHPFCSAALRMRFQMIERGQHSLTLHIVDDDGNLVVPAIEGAFSVEIPGNSQIASANLILNLGQLRFKNYGEYAINLAIDSRQEATLPFWVREPPKG